MKRALRRFAFMLKRGLKALRDGSYYGRKLGKGEGYIYPHSDPAGFDVDHLPDELKGTTYYEPSGSGEEAPA